MDETAFALVSSTSLPVKNKIKPVLAIALIVFILDHLTKWLIVEYVPMGTEISVLPGYFDIVHGRNTGAAFGMFADWQSSYKNLFFYVVGVFAAIFIYHYIKTLADDDRWSLYALSLVVGGALGNITDRMLRGSVVDFLSVHIHDDVWNLKLFGQEMMVPLTWPAFNVADAAITIAIVLLVVQNFRTMKHK